MRRLINCANAMSLRNFAPISQRHADDNVGVKPGETQVFVPWVVMGQGPEGLRTSTRG
jgi:hypothetical protein